MQAPWQGDMIIRALVRARLFGMQILTLDARVVVGADNGSRTVAPPPHGPVGSGSRSSVPALASSGPGPGLVRAIELLEQGTETLERSRRRGYHSARDHHLSAGVRIHRALGRRGEPIVLVEKGKIIYRIMRRERLTLDDLAEEARISEIESLDEVQ